MEIAWPLKVVEQELDGKRHRVEYVDQRGKPIREKDWESWEWVEITMMSDLPRKRRWLAIRPRDAPTTAQEPE